MPILVKGKTFGSTEQVTSAKLHQLVDSATFDPGAADGSTLEVSGGALRVKDAGITGAKLSSTIAIPSGATGVTQSPATNNTSLATTAFSILGDRSITGGESEATVASATTTDIGAAASNRVQITGTTTITGFGTTANVIRLVRFAGAITLTHNATSLILLGAANITTAAGDTAIFSSDGSGNWRCMSYQRASGQALVFTAVNAAQLCKAWVNFNGTGTVAIRDQYNVSSITDNGVGNYRVNYTSAMANVNYSFFGSTRRSDGSAGDPNGQCIPRGTSTYSLTTGYVDIAVGLPSVGGAADYDFVACSIFSN